MALTSTTPGNPARPFAQPNLHVCPTPFDFLSRARCLRAFALPTSAPKDHAVPLRPSQPCHSSYLSQKQRGLLVSLRGVPPHTHLTSPGTPLPALCSPSLGLGTGLPPCWLGRCPGSLLRPSGAVSGGCFVSLPGAPSHTSHAQASGQTSLPRSFCSGRSLYLLHRAPASLSSKLLSVLQSPAPMSPLL